MITLQNGKITATVSEYGAELQTLIAADGRNYLFDGRAPFWHGRSPVLFPTIGKLRGGEAMSANGAVTIPKHGFCRNKTFAVTEQSDRTVTLTLSDSDETRAQYPYAFRFSVIFSLCGETLCVTYRVENTGDTVMPYTVGAHPAFRIPLCEGEAYTDYIVEFPLPETADCPQVNLETGLIVDGVRNRLLDGETGFRLNHVLFRGDALVFDQLKSRSVRLYSQKSGVGVKVDFADFDRLGVWTMADDEPFVCLEPWLGSPTLESEDDVFEHKTGMQLLPAGQSAEHAYQVTVF